MSCQIVFNRDGGIGNDGWIHIVPKGRLPNAQAGVVQILDDQALNSILSDLEAQKQRLGQNWPGLYFGLEHHIFDPDKSSEAFAWGKQFQKRDNGIWCKPEWTDIGADAVRNRRFKFTSFTANGSDLEPLGENQYRVLAIETVGLTNFANGKELLTPITNRAHGVAQPNSRDDSGACAAKTLEAMAIEEQRQSGGSLASCYIRVMNREPLLAATALGKSRHQSARPASRQRTDLSLGDIAAKTIIRRAKTLGSVSLSDGIRHVSNRYPRLAKIANKKADWDCLKDLEPVAHSYFLKAVEMDRTDVCPPNIWRDFLKEIDSLAIQFPDLGYEGRWEKFQELHPEEFWQWVSNFEDDHDFAGAPILCTKEKYDEVTAELIQQKKAALGTATNRLRNR